MTSSGVVGILETAVLRYMYSTKTCGFWLYWQTEVVKEIIKEDIHDTGRSPLFSNAAAEDVIVVRYRDRAKLVNITSKGNTSIKWDISFPRGATMWRREGSA